MKPKVIKNYKMPSCMEEMPFGSSSEAGTLIKINAGYRTFYPKIDHEKCIHCLMCFVYCPEGSISKDGKELTVDMDYCKGCGICAHECPRKCITMVKEGE